MNKIKILLGMVIVAVVFVLTGCADANDDTSNSNEGKTIDSSNGIVSCLLSDELNDVEHLRRIYSDEDVVFKLATELTRVGTSGWSEEAVDSYIETILENGNRYLHGDDFITHIIYSEGEEIYEHEVSLRNLVNLETRQLSMEAIVEHYESNSFTCYIGDGVQESEERIAQHIIQRNEQAEQNNELMAEVKELLNEMTELEEQLSQEVFHLLNGSWEGSHSNDWLSSEEVITFKNGFFTSDIIEFENDEEFTFSHEGEVLVSLNLGLDFYQEKLERFESAMMGKSEDVEEALNIVRTTINSLANVNLNTMINDNRLTIHVRRSEIYKLDSNSFIKRDEYEEENEIIFTRRAVEKEN